MSNWILEYHGVPMFRQTYIQEVLMHCTERGATWCTGQSLFRSCTSRGLCLKHFGDTTSASRRVKCGWEAIWSDKQWLGHRPLQLYKAENDRKSMKTILKMHVFFCKWHLHPSSSIYYDTLNIAEFGRLGPWGNVKEQEPGKSGAKVELLEQLGPFPVSFPVSSPGPDAKRHNIASCSEHLDDDGKLMVNHLAMTCYD